MSAISDDVSPCFAAGGFTSVLEGPTFSLDAMSASLFLTSRMILPGDAATLVRSFAFFLACTAGEAALLPSLAPDLAGEANLELPPRGVWYPPLLPPCPGRILLGDAIPCATPLALLRNRAASLSRFSLTYAVGSNRGDDAPDRTGPGDRPLTSGDGDLPRVGVLNPPRSPAGAGDGERARATPPGVHGRA